MPDRATAPSMDGIASNSSAMEISGVKTTVYNRDPALVVCDTGVMAQAPMEMRQSGLGDMLAKYTSQRALAGSSDDWRVLLRARLEHAAVGRWPRG